MSPQLPRYDSQRNIQAGLAQPMRQEASFQGSLSDKITSTLMEINDKWMQARDVMEYTDARVKHSVELADIQARAAEEQDFNKSGEYLKELQRADQNYLGGIKNKAIAEKASLDFRYNSEIAGLKIESGFRQKELAYNKKSLSTGISTLLQESMAASTEGERGEKKLEITEMLMLNVNNGTITQAEAGEIFYDSQKNVATFDAQYNPERFLANKKDYGLNTSDEAKTEALAKTNKERIEGEEKEFRFETHKKNEIDLVKRFIGGETISISEISELANDDLISNDFRGAFIIAVSTPKVKDKEINENAFMFIMDTLIKADDNEGVMNVLVETLNKTGKIKQTELDAILQFTTEHMLGDNRNFLQKVLDQVMKIHEYAPSRIATKSIMDFIKNINNGDDPIKAKQKAEFSTAIETNQSLMNLSDNGTIMQDPVTGVRKRVFKDGRIEDVK